MHFRRTRKPLHLAELSWFSNRTRSVKQFITRPQMGKLARSSRKPTSTGSDRHHYCELRKPVPARRSGHLPETEVIGLLSPDRQLLSPDQQLLSPAACQLPGCRRAHGPGRGEAMRSEATDRHDRLPGSRRASARGTAHRRVAVDITDK